MIALAAKETFATALYPNNDNSYFIVDNEDDYFDTLSNDSLFVDGNKDGPFQVETPAMATDVSVLPQRFYFGDSSTPESERKPQYENIVKVMNRYLSDNELLVDYNKFREYHDSVTGDFYKAIVLSCLDLHFRHNIIMQMINAFQEFSGPYLITKGGPMKSTYLYGLFIYDSAFSYLKMGYASALSWIMFIVIMIVTVIILGSSRYWAFYQDGEQ